MAHGVSCHTYWGSHGCALVAGHDGPHVCGEGEEAWFVADSEFDGTYARLREFDVDDEPVGWSDWMDWVTPTS